MVEEGAIFGMGNPLLDIAATVPDSVFERYGVKPNNAILAEEKHLPVYKDLADNYDVLYVAGGATQNAIRVAQWMLQEPKHATSFIGAVGKDDFGDKLEEAARKDNVNVHYLKVEEATGTCAVLVDGKGERSLVANISAAGKYDPSHLAQPDSQALLNKARVCYIAGFFLTVSPPAALEVARHCEENKKTFCMNLAAPFICTFFKDPLMQCMPYVDIVFGNESEAVAFAEGQGWETRDVAEIAKLIAALPRNPNSSSPRVAVITQGSKSTLVAIKGDVHVFPVQKIDPSELVDANGAGDAFVGGFLSQLVQGGKEGGDKPYERCVLAGHYSAGVVIRHPSCTFPAKPDFK